MNIKPRFILIILAFTFFLSGGAALLYQVIWQRLLGLFSGSDVRSVTIVVSAFLGGLGIGSLLGALLSDRMSSRQAVRVFGCCNFGIALFALMSRWLYYDLLFLRFRGLAASTSSLMVISFISLLWPTILMGMSLPLLSKAVVRNIQQAARRISLLDGMNTLGAGISALGTGWFLAGTLGYEKTLLLGAGLSILVGLIALGISSQFRPDDKVETKKEKRTLKSVPSEVWYWSILTFTSGFMVIALELVWFRILDVSLKSNAYTFAYLLAFFLVGDGIGTLLAALFLPRINQPRAVFLWIVALVSLYSLAAVRFASWLAIEFQPFNRYISQQIDLNTFIWSAPKDTLLIYLVLPVLLMMPPAILFGFYFPIVQKAIQREYAVIGQRVGLIKMANIMGNAGGGIFTGLVFLHFYGTSGSLRIIGFLGLSFTLLLLFHFKGEKKLFSQLKALCAAILLFFLIISFPDSRELWASLHGARQGDTFLVSEDSTGVAAIRQRPDRWAVIFANGQTQGAIPFLSIHGLLGALPALVHPNPENIMIIGIGSAGTPYAAGINYNTRNILAIEIIGSELDVLRDYSKNHEGNPLTEFFSDERYKIIIGDGRRELIHTDKKFDIIQADAIRPTGSHSGLLYSREFFLAVSNKLAPGGIMAQWRATSRVEDTFVSVFPYAVNIGNMVLLGSNEPIPYNPQGILALLNESHYIDYLENGTYRVSDFRNAVLGPTYFWTPYTPRPRRQVNTDLHPRDEYFLNN